MSEFHEHAPNVKNFQFLEKKDQHFRKIREYFANVQIIQKIIQNYSVVSLEVVLLDPDMILVAPLRIPSPRTLAMSANVTWRVGELFSNFCSFKQNFEKSLTNFC